MKKNLFITIIFIIFSLVLFCFTIDAAETQKVHVIPVSGDVEPAMAAFIKRSMKEAVDNNAITVLKLDTFGGRVDAALQIVETMTTNAPERTIAFVATKAISAGALIALANNDLVMRPNTTIGDCAPIAYSNDGPKVMGEKFQSPLRAKFRALARRNNYPIRLSESMVTAEMVVYQVEIDGKKEYMDGQEFDDLSEEEKGKITSKKTIVKKGELLTMDDSEALDLGFSRMTANTIEEALDKFGIQNYQLVTIEQNWSETMGRFIAKISPILLMIGLAALYTELKAPGFGVPGLVGILCLGFVFLNQYLVGLASYTDLIFLILGVSLLAIEFFVLPGFGIAGVAGFACIAAGMILSFQDFVVPDPNLPWQGDILTRNIIQMLGSFVSAFVLSLFFLRYIFPRLSTVMPGPYLDTTLSQSHADSNETKKIHVGDKGKAVTYLRPAGKMKIDNDIVDVITEGEFIEKDSEIIISDIQGNIIKVRRFGI